MTGIQREVGREGGREESGGEREREERKERKGKHAVKYPISLPTTTLWVVVRKRGHYFRNLSEQVQISVKHFSLLQNDKICYTKMPSFRCPKTH